VLVAGRSETDDYLDGLPPAVAERIDLLGQVSEADKARMLHSVDVYCAPNTGGESFGVILLEAMAAGTPIVASDLVPFRRVLADGSAGRLFRTGDAAALAAALGEVLDDAELRGRLVAAGTRAVAPFDWSVIVAEVLRVYELAIAGAGLTS
jgi:phosphatidylinositol alpha-mannosyltransferase